MTVASLLDHEKTLVEQMRSFAPMMMAYVECSDALQLHARKMILAIMDPSLDEDDRQLAAMTLADILYPNPHEGLLGSDLQECEAQGAAHSEETRQALEVMDQEEASFADSLRQAMEKTGITQAELAMKVGIGQPAISMMLQRDCRPQKRTVAKLAEALGTVPEALWPNHMARHSS